jgi:hypothetical protein
LKSGRRQWIARHHGEEVAATYDIDIGPLGWLVDLMEDAGAVRIVPTGMGALTTGLGWPEIAAWVEGAGEQSLSPTFRRGVMLLSAHYAAQVEASREMACPAPFDPGKAD